MMNDDIPRRILEGWDVAASLLKFYGATVHTATNGKEGLALIREVRPLFIITDLSMPTLDGWGLIKQLKADRTTLDIPVIALTAHAMKGDRERGLAAGFHNYLTKPLTVETFMDDLMKVLVEIPEIVEQLDV